MKKVTKRLTLIVLMVSALIVGVSFGFLMFDRENYILNRQSDEMVSEMCDPAIAISTRYIEEIVIPTPCSGPIGITSDSYGNIWFSETKSNKIGVFSIENKKFREFTIPIEADSIRMVESWSLIFDQEGMLWFTDHSNNAIWRFNPMNEKFEMFKIPTPGSFPIQLVIDKHGNIWFSEIYGNKIARIDPSRVKAGSSDGFLEFEPPGKLELLGGIWIDDHGKVWFAMLTYPLVGKIGIYDPIIDEFNVIDLPDGISSPVGIVTDQSGRAWISDHGTSHFVLFDSTNRSFTKFATSIGKTEYSTTLPYWNLLDDDGNIWFNVHQSNTIAKFDIKKWVLVEYDIPSKNPDWGGISNTLQFTIDPAGNVWFTEWTENKIGILDTSMQLPFSLESSTREIKMTIDSSTEFYITLTTHEEVTIDLDASGTFSISGNLVNITAIFESNTIDLDGNVRVNVVLNADDTLLPGEYTLMVSATGDSITQSIPIRLLVTDF